MCVSLFQSHLRACYLQLAANLKKQKADEKFSTMLEDQKEDFKRKALELEKTVDNMHSVELEAEQLIKVEANGMWKLKLGLDLLYIEALSNVKSENLQLIDEIHQSATIKEQNSNVELLDARKLLIKVGFFE